jgi:hypothetical protein
MENYYNYSTIKIKADGADALILKPICGDKITVTTIEDGYFTTDTTDWIAGKYYLQFMNGTEIIKSDSINIKQNLAYVDGDFDPRSQYEIVIEAIDAMLQNRATAQQKKIQIGDKSIEYSTFSELLQWRKYMVEQLRKEQGKNTTLTMEIGVFKRW